MINMYLAGAKLPTVAEDVLRLGGYNRLYSQFNDRSAIKEYANERTGLLLIDSGAYTAHKKDVDISVDDYINYLNENTKKFDYFIQLDTIPGKFGKPKTKEDYLVAAKQSFENFEYMLSKLEEPDLMMYHLNGALHGVVPSMKHGDRSTFFAYNFGKALYPKDQTGTVGSSLQILEDNLIEQIELELKFVQDLKNQNLPVQNSQLIKEGAFGKEILGDDYKTALETGKINETKVKLFVAEQFKAYKDYVESLGLLDPTTSTSYDNEGKSFRETNVKGLDKSLLNGWNVDAMLASAFINEVSNHIFELRFFSGSAQIFKSGTDLFKRLVPQSSTGLLAVNSDRVNEHVRQQLNQVHTIYNPRTKQYEEVNTSSKLEDGYFRAVTGEEREDYKSFLLDPAVDESGNQLISKLTGKQESILFMTFEDGFIKDYPDMSIDDLKKIYKPKFELYEKKYSKINENDGQSYMTLPGFKNFMIRQGNWNDGFELVYQTEMKIASLSSKEDIANIEIEFKGVTFKPFEINPTEFNGRKIDGWKEKLIGNKVIKTEALHTLKTQFAGYSTPEEYYRDMNKQVQYWFN